jgi:hypothetical protein
MTRDNQPTRYGRVDVATTNMAHSLKQDDAALNNCFIYVLRRTSFVWNLAGCVNVQVLFCGIAVYRYVTFWLITILLL